MSGINNYFSNNNIFNGTEIPTQGKFDVGDIIVNIGENAEEEPMWMCIEAGEPGVWKVVGKVEEIDLSGYQEKTDENLVTESKDLVGAINELFQNANNGKELIASAIGEPLNAEDTFSAMSTDINSLLSTFKTNMMNNGVTIEAGDKFKSLIDKIATMVEEGSGKGIQFASGVFNDINLVTGDNIISFPDPLDFTPSIVFITLKNAIVGSMMFNLNTTIDSSFCNSSNTTTKYQLKCYVTNVTNNGFTLNSGSMSTLYTPSWYAIGVGEEDTTLRDSLASILEEEGVSVTEEDDMASLITKVDEEFSDKEDAINEKNNIINELETDTDKWVNLLELAGYNVDNIYNMDDMYEILEKKCLAIKNVEKVFCNNDSTFIIKNDGSLWACGNNNYGQLGLGNTTNRSVFTKVTTNTNNDVKEVFCSEYSGFTNNYGSTFVIKNDGSLWACGFNDEYSSGHLGLNDTTDRTTFTQVTTNINNDVEQVACGYEHTLILKNDGSVWGCGRSSSGQLGGVSGWTFTQITDNINNDVKQIACGGNFTFILKNDGSLLSCGYNKYNELGRATGRYSNSTFGTVTTNVKQVSCGAFNTLILKNDGSLWACGRNLYGELGTEEIGSDDENYYGSITQITNNINNDVREIICGCYTHYIIKNDGTIWSCGHNNYGQLGLGDTTARTEFTQVTDINVNDVKQIAVGRCCILLLKNDGMLWVCGFNNSGQLGLGNTTNATTFTRRKGFSL